MIHTIDLLSSEECTKLAHSSINSLLGSYYKWDKIDKALHIIEDSLRGGSTCVCCQRSSAFHCDDCELNAVGKSCDSRNGVTYTEACDSFDITLDIVHKFSIGLKQMYEKEIAQSQSKKGKKDAKHSHF